MHRDSTAKPTEFILSLSGELINAPWEYFTGQGTTVYTG